MSDVVDIERLGTEGEREREREIKQAGGQSNQFLASQFIMLILSIQFCDLILKVDQKNLTIHTLFYLVFPPLPFKHTLSARGI